MEGICRNCIKMVFFIFASFEQFLVSNRATQQKHFPYYIKWVTNCKDSLESSAEKILTADQKNSSLLCWKTLVKTGKSSKLNRHYGYPTHSSGHLTQFTFTVFNPHRGISPTKWFASPPT
jgi:hypothetical protein